MIYDYVDVYIPVLERMYNKRLTAYRFIGYSIKSGSSKGVIKNSISGIYDESNYFEHLIQDIKKAEKTYLYQALFFFKRKKLIK